MHLTGDMVRIFAGHPYNSVVRSQIEAIADALSALPEVDIDFYGILKAYHCSVSYVRICFDRGCISILRKPQAPDGDGWVPMGTMRALGTTYYSVDYIGHRALAELLRDFDQLYEVGPEFATAATSFEQCE